MKARKLGKERAAQVMIITRLNDVAGSPPRDENQGAMPEGD